MKRIASPTSTLLLALALSIPIPAHAFLNHVDFSFAYTDPFAGSGIAAGSFSYDDGLLPSAGGWVVPPAGRWSISFTFAGHAFATSDAGLNLHSDTAGNLDIWSLLSEPNTMAVAPGFVLDAWAGYSPSGTIYPIEVTYWTAANPPGGSTSSGRWAISRVAEPASAAILGFGLPLLLLGYLGRRERS